MTTKQMTFALFFISFCVMILGCSTDCNCTEIVNQEPPFYHFSPAPAFEIRNDIPYWYGKTGDEVLNLQPHQIIDFQEAHQIDDYGWFILTDEISIWKDSVTTVEGWQEIDSMIGIE